MLSVIAFVENSHGNRKVKTNIFQSELFFFTLGRKNVSESYRNYILSSAEGKSQEVKDISVLLIASNRASALNSWKLDSATS